MRRLSSSVLTDLSRAGAIARSFPGALHLLCCNHALSSQFPQTPTTLAAIHSRANGPFLFRPGRLSRLPRFPTRDMTSVQEKAQPLLQRRKLELEEAFEVASTTEEILATFRAFEASLGEGDELKLGLACLKVGQHLESVGYKDQEQTMDFARRALGILEGDGERSIMAVMALHLVGAVSYNLQRFSDSLAHLNKANRILEKIKGGDCGEFDVMPVIHAVQLQLASTKTAMGRREEAILNLRKCLEVKESMFGKNSKEVGGSYRDLAEAYVAVLDFKQALPLCLNALDIHREKLGQNSVEVAHDRRLLAVIYTGLEEHQKALEQNQQSQKVMKNWGLDYDLHNAEIEAANMQIALGKYEEAVSTLRDVVQHTSEESLIRALVFISMAKALSNQEKLADSKRCLEISCGILEKRERDSAAEVAKGYADIAEMYETMSDFDTAISLLKRAALLFEKLPQEQYAEANASARIGWLLLLTGKVHEGVPFLETAAERLKENFGPKHYAVGYIYNNLGAAYLELDRPQSAAQMFALAKDIMDVSLGCHHADSIGACQNLANAYDAIHNFDLALEFQQQVVDAWKGHGPNYEDRLQEAKHRLQELEKKVTNQVLDVLEAEESTARDGEVLDSAKMIPSKT